MPILNEYSFEDIALALFQDQYKNNLLYQTYVDALGKNWKKVNALHDIPFLPIRFFKTHAVTTGNATPEILFTSSATTGQTVSKHYVPKLETYTANATQIFRQFYGNLSDYHFLALLPSYLERQGSSLIAMMDHFIKSDPTGQSGYYLHDYQKLHDQIKSLAKSSKKIMVWGVSFALLDWAEKMEIDLSNCIIVETGGMKGRRKEWVRDELHHYLCRRFNVSKIHSEYGMTELMSQAYSQGNGCYRCPSGMKVLVRDINDPFCMVDTGEVGAINIIDLANTSSCAFVETEDLGKSNQDFSFEILGRMDNTETRGCNLLVI